MRANLKKLLLRKKQELVIRFGLYLYCSSFEGSSWIMKNVAFELPDKYKVVFSI